VLIENLSLVAEAEEHPFVFPPVDAETLKGVARLQADAIKPRLVGETFLLDLIEPEVQPHNNVVMLGEMPWAVHFALRSILVALAPDVVLRNIYKVAGEQVDSFLHKQSRQAALNALTLTVSLFTNVQIPRHAEFAFNLVVSHVDAVFDILQSNHYSHRQRNAAANEIRAAIETWSVVLYDAVG
jgi:hypothetical protein